MKKQNPQRELEELRHSNKMEEITFKCQCEKEVTKLQHELEMERQRIKSAEIRKSVMMKKYS